MGGYPENPGPLPAVDFCNKTGKKNPINGKGPLGNQYTGKMSYDEADREERVTSVQKMLMDLGYDIGLTEGDGKFGNATEGGVKEFQKEHTDWEGNALNADGLVGPKTSDALNREMVGRWYDAYPTPTDLTEDKCCYTVIEKKVSEGLEITPGEAETVHLFIVQPSPGGFIPWIDFQTVDDFGHRLGERTIILEYPDGTSKELVTNNKGYHREKKVPRGKIPVSLPDGTPAKMRSGDMERDAVINTENLRYAIVDIIVEHRATEEVMKQRETNRKLYQRNPDTKEEVSSRKKAFDSKKGEFTGEDTKIKTRKSKCRTIDNLALAAGWSGDNEGVNLSRFLPVLSQWLADYFPVAIERGYIVHILAGADLNTYDSKGKDLGKCKVNKEVQGLMGAYTAFAEETGPVFVDMVNRKYPTPVKGHETSVLGLDEIVDDPTVIQAINQNHPSKVEILYLLPTKSHLYWLSLYGGTGSLEDYGRDGAVNKTIHERNLAVVKTVYLTHHWYLKDYIELVKKTKDENGLRALGPPCQPYIFPAPAGATDEQVTELFRANVTSSLPAWQAIADRLARFADEVPDGTFFGSIKIEVDKIGGGDKPYINGGSVKYNLYFDDDLKPVLLEPEMEVKIGTGGEKTFTSKTGKKVNLGLAIERKMNPKTGQFDESYKVKAGAGEVEITPKGDMKLEFGPGKAGGVYSETSPQSGQFGGGFYFNIGENKKIYVGIHFQGVKEESLLAYFCRAPGFFERRGLDDLLSPKLQWVDLFPDEVKAFEALGFTQKIWDSRYISSKQLPGSVKNSFDELTPQQKCAAVVLGLRRSTWGDAWKKLGQSTAA